MLKVLSRIFMVFIAIFMVILAMTSTTALSSVHAASPAFSKADIDLVRSLQPKFHNLVKVRSNDKNSTTQTVDLGNSSFVHVALQRKDLSPQLREALAHIVTKLIVSANGSRTLENPNIHSLPSSVSVPVCTTADGSVTAQNDIGLNIFYYAVTQPFCGDGSNVISYGSRTPSSAIEYIGWSYSGDTSSLSSPSIGVTAATEFNIGIFNYAPLHFVNFQTRSAHINLYMYGAGYWDVGTFLS